MAPAAPRPEAVEQLSSTDKVLLLMTETLGADAAGKVLGEAYALSNWRRVMQAMGSSGLATATATVTTTVATTTVTTTARRRKPKAPVGPQSRWTEPSPLSAQSSHGTAGKGFGCCKGFVESHGILSPTGSGQAPGLGLEPAVA